MSTTYILILTMSVWRGGAAIEMHEFESRSSCMKAAEFWLGDVKHMRVFEKSAVCVPKK